MNLDKIHSKNIFKESQKIIESSYFEKALDEFNKGESVIEKYMEVWSPIMREIFDYHFNEKGDYICSQEEKQLFNHDVIGGVTHGFIASKRFLREGDVNISEMEKEYFSRYIDNVRFAVYYIQSLAVYKASSQELEVQKDEWKTLFSLQSLLGFIKRISNFQNITIDNFKDNLVKKLEGDTAILILNIIKNAYSRGEARNMKIFRDNDWLCFADDGKGIRMDNPNEIFKKGITDSQSTGLGLRDMEERGFEAEASNLGLPNKEGEKGALIKIKI